MHHPWPIPSRWQGLAMILVAIALVATMAVYGHAPSLVEAALMIFLAGVWHVEFLSLQER